MKRTADSSTTFEACPKSTSHGRRASGIASGSIPTAITRSTPRRYGNGGSGQSNKGSTLLFSKLYVSYSGILVLLADASILDERAPPMQGVLISWMLRLFIIYIGRGIHHARGCGVAASHLGKLLRHHRLLCRGADGIDVRGDHLDRGGSGAKVEWDACGIRHANRRTFLCRAAGRRDSQRAVARALACWPYAGSLWSRGRDIRRHRGTAGTPSDGLPTGTGGLAVARGLSARLLHCPP